MKRVLIAILAFCVGLLAQNIQYRPDPSWRPPDSAAARVNPLAGSPELAAAGASSSSASARNATAPRARA